MLCKGCRREGLACVCPKTPEHKLSKDARKLLAQLKDRVHTYGYGKRLPFEHDWPPERFERAMRELEKGNWINLERSR